MYDRELAGRELELGVSGLLYESNLLMYDRETESLWVQATGEAVVGELLGKRLERMHMQVITFAELSRRYPDAQVLSKDTGYARDYETNPYSAYEESDELLFDVSVEDRRYPAKQHVWVFEVRDRSVAIPIDSLSGRTATKTIEGAVVAASRDGSIITIRVDGEKVPGFREMWFIWATFNQDDGIVWDPAKAGGT